MKRRPRNPNQKPKSQPQVDTRPRDRILSRLQGRSGPVCLRVVGARSRRRRAGRGGRRANRSSRRL